MTFITGKHLSRRTLLQGIGSTIAYWIVVLLLWGLIEASAGMRP